MKIAFDPKEMRPGCALIQAALGCGTSIAHEFPVGSWLLAPTPELGVYEVNEVELSKLVLLVRLRHGE